MQRLFYLATLYNISMFLSNKKSHQNSAPFTYRSKENSKSLKEEIMAFAFDT